MVDCLKFFLPSIRDPTRTLPKPRAAEAWARGFDDLTVFRNVQNACARASVRFGVTLVNLAARFAGRCSETGGVFAPAGVTCVWVIFLEFGDGS